MFHETCTLPSAEALAERPDTTTGFAGRMQTSGAAMPGALIVILYSRERSGMAVEKVDSVTVAVTVVKSCASQVTCHDDGVFSAAVQFRVSDCALISEKL